MADFEYQWLLPAFMTDLHAIPQTNQTTQEYFEHVRSLQGLVPGVTYLYTFLKHRDWNIGPTDPRLSMLGIEASTVTWTDVPLMPLEDRQENLDKLFEKQSTCKLYFIEGITPDLVVILGAKYNIPPQFFAQHLNADTWEADPTYIGNSHIEYPFWYSENVPALPSEVKSQNFFQLRYLDSRVQGGVDVRKKTDTKDGELAPEQPCVKECKHGWLCTKRQVSVWYKKQGDGWIGKLIVTETILILYWC
jgi:hypothetical protein